jgi:UDP-glucose 4-epimerase
VSIGALLSELSRLRRRRGPVVLGGGDARGQALDLRIRSEVWTDLDGLVRTTLPEGLSRVYQAQLLGRASGH